MTRLSNGILLAIARTTITKYVQKYNVAGEDGQFLHRGNNANEHLFTKIYLLIHAKYYKYSVMRLCG